MQLLAVADAFICLDALMAFGTSNAGRPNAHFAIQMPPLENPGLKIQAPRLQAQRSCGGVSS
jgi:hypothetical protein